MDAETHYSQISCFCSPLSLVTCTDKEYLKMQNHLLLQSNTALIIESGNLVVKYAISYNKVN